MITLMGNKTSNALTLSDKVKKTGEHMANFHKTQAKTGVATAAIAGGTYAALKSSSINKGVMKIINKVKNTSAFKQYAPKIGDLASKVAGKFKALPASGKAIVATGSALALLVTSAIGGKANQNFGKIEQKYEDKAALREKFTD